MQWYRPSREKTESKTSSPELKTSKYVDCGMMGARRRQDDSTNKVPASLSAQNSKDFSLNIYLISGPFRGGPILHIH